MRQDIIRFWVGEKEEILPKFCWGFCVVLHLFVVKSVVRARKFVAFLYFAVSPAPLWMAKKEDRSTAISRNSFFERFAYEKECVARSIAPQECQGCKRVLNRRMAAKRLSAGFGFVCTRGYPM